MRSLITTVVTSLCLSSTAPAQDYDLVIPNGRVMDPENLYDDIANVAVRDGRIVAITKERIEGKDTIDALAELRIRR